jgi:hypothetical protein
LRNLRKGLALLICLFVLSSCNESGSNITIEPYELSNKEQLLLEKTGVGMISYFTINGSLAETEDIRYEVQIFENGKDTNGMFSLHGEMKRNLDNEIISFGVNTYQSGENGSVSTLLAGQPDGLTSTTKDHNMSSYSFSPLVNESITLSKNEPVYLAVWAGTTKDTLESLSSVNGALPDRIKDTELAFIYKITLVDK